MKNIDVEFFSNNPGDLEFLQCFIHKQSFVYFLDNDLYMFNAKNAEVLQLPVIVFIRITLLKLNTT